MPRQPLLSLADAVPGNGFALAVSDLPEQVSGLDAIADARFRVSGQDMEPADVIESPGPSMLIARPREQAHGKARVPQRLGIPVLFGQ